MVINKIQSINMLKILYMNVKNISLESLLNCYRYIPIIEFLLNEVVKNLFNITKDGRPELLTNFD